VVRAPRLREPSVRRCPKPSVTLLPGQFDKQQLIRGARDARVTSREPRASPLAPMDLIADGPK